MEFGQTVRKIWFWRWWLITSAVLAAVSTFTAGILLPTTYEATVLFATSRSGTDARLGSNIETLTDDQLQGLNGSSDRTARLEGYATLATRPSIAAEVLPRFNDRLKALNPVYIDSAIFSQEFVSAGLLAGTDILALTIKFEDPQLAADIANDWAMVFETTINSTQGRLGTTDLSRISQMTTDALQASQESHALYAAFLANNQIPYLRNRIAFLNEEITAISDMIISGISIASRSELELRQARLASVFAEILRLEILLDDARALEKQISSRYPSNATQLGDTLALLTLRGQSFVRSADNFELQVQLPMYLQAGPIWTDDVAAVIRVIEGRLTELDQDIATHFSGLLDPAQHDLDAGEILDLLNKLEQLIAERQAASAELDEEESRENYLIQQKNLAWETYQQLSIKEKEIKVAIGSDPTEIRIASYATVPSRAIGMSPLLMAFFGGLIGIIGAFLVLLLQEQIRSN